MDLSMIHDPSHEKRYLSTSTSIICTHFFRKTAELFEFCEFKDCESDF